MPSRPTRQRKNRQTLKENNNRGPSTDSIGSSYAQLCRGGQTSHTDGYILYLQINHLFLL